MSGIFYPVVTVAPADTRFSGLTSHSYLCYTDYANGKIYSGGFGLDAGIYIFPMAGMVGRAFGLTRVNCEARGYNDVSTCAEACPSYYAKRWIANGSANQINSVLHAQTSNRDNLYFGYSTCKNIPPDLSQSQIDIMQVAP